MGFVGLVEFCMSVLSFFLFIRLNTICQIVFGMSLDLVGWAS